MGTTGSFAFGAIGAGAVASRRLSFGCAGAGVATGVVAVAGAIDEEGATDETGFCVRASGRFAGGVESGVVAAAGAVEAAGAVAAGVAEVAALGAVTGAVVAAVAGAAVAPVAGAAFGVGAGSVLSRAAFTVGGAMLFGFSVFIFCFSSACVFGSPVQPRSKFGCAIFSFTTFGAIGAVGF